MRSDFENACKVFGKVERFLNKGSLKEAESYLKDDEQVLHVEGVNLGKTPGILVVTDKRIFFTMKIANNYEFKQIKYDEINTVTTGGTLNKGLAIQTSHEQLDVTSINYKRVKDVHRSIMQHVS
jgi:hypothetical protein